MVIIIAEGLIEGRCGQLDHVVLVWGVFIVFPCISVDVDRENVVNLNRCHIDVFAIISDVYVPCECHCTVRLVIGSYLKLDWTRGKIVIKSTCNGIVILNGTR